MLNKYNRKKQKGIVPALLAVVVGVVSIVLLILIAALIVWLAHLVAGLVGGGNQPAGNSNIGCHLEGPDTSKATSSTTKTFSLTAFYHPVKGQVKYEQGSYEAELRMEGGGSGASGIKLERGAIAAPPSYPFGTEIDVSGFGRGVVVDRGCAIQEAGVPSKCPGLANVTTKYDHLDLFTGEGDEGRMAMNKWNGKEAQGTVYYFSFINANNLKDNVKVVCQSLGVSGSGPCGQNLVDIAIAELGTKENPPGSDCVPYNNCDGVAWCDTFVNWVFKKAGFDYMYKNCYEYLVCSQNYFRKYQTFIDVKNGDTSQIRPGDYFWQQNTANNSGWHVGLVEYVSGDQIHTIEGNASRMVKRNVKKAGPGNLQIHFVGRLKNCNL